MCFLHICFQWVLTFVEKKNFAYLNLSVMNFGLPSSSLVDLIVLECISRFLLEKTDSNSIESVPSAEAISVFLCFRCSSVANTSLLFNVFFFLGNVSCVYVCVFILLSFSLEGFVFLLLVIMIFLLCFPFSVTFVG